MSETPQDTTATLLWTDEAHAALLGRVLEQMGDALNPLAVGGPRGPETAALAQQLDRTHSDDLRSMIVEHDAAYLFLATDDEVDIDDLKAAWQKGVHILTIEPLTHDLASWSELTQAFPNHTALLSQTPAFLASPGYAKAAEPHEIVGPGRSLVYENIGSHLGGSLFARLFDAWDTALAFLDVPETVSASLVGPLGAPPENPRSLTGHLTAHGRSHDGGSVAIMASDRAGRVSRRLHVLGSSGQLRVTDAGYWLVNAEGEPVDAHDTDAQQPGEVAAVPSLVELIETEWSRLLSRPAMTQQAPSDRPAEVLACCLASLLSARTGQAESPSMFLRIGR